ncbi:MAG: hypothetical protein COA79_05095 [Planctomycetota bacterium]|nr:MAG: hypothetical protein COA79_05095 [Planctomycetota bacterium]
MEILDQIINMEPMRILLILVIGLVVGFLIGLTGIGGGVLSLPALTEILGVESTVAVGTASLYASLTKIYAVFEHYRLKTIDFISSCIFLSGALPGCIIVGYITVKSLEGLSKTEQLSYQQNFKLLIAYILLLTVFILVFNFISFLKKESSSEPVKIEKPNTKKQIIGAMLGVFIGALIGVSSIGGGALVIPVLIILFGLSAKETVGSSIFIGVLLTLATAIIYGKGGQLDYGIAILMAFGSILGVFFGTRLTEKVPDKILQGLVIGIITLACITMLVRAHMAIN